MDVIDARGVTHEYPDGTTAIRDVDIRVERGERVAVVGANGSGKSTLQLVLGGLVDRTAGTIRYFEETTDPEAVRERLGVLLQDPDDYLFNTTVREDLEYGPSQLGVPKEAATRRIRRLAADLGHILAASGVGAGLDAAALPITPELAAAGSAEQVRAWVLGGGDDYELCFTGPDDLDAERLTATDGVAVTRIGRITGGGGLQLVEPDGSRSASADHAGYRHFGP